MGKRCKLCDVPNTSLSLKHSLAGGLFSIRFVIEGKRREVNGGCD